MVQLLLVVFGCIAIFRGEFSITRKRRVSGSLSRNLGYFMLGGAVVSFFFGGLIAIATFVLAMLIAWSNTEPIEPEAT